MSHKFVAGAFVEQSWHGREVDSGGLIVGNPNLWVQMQKSQMDYEVHRIPATYVLPDGTVLEDPKFANIVREPTAWDSNWPPMRPVANRYKPVNNSDLATTLQPLADHWPVWGLGALDEGRIVFVELRLDPFDVGGHPDEQHLIYLLVANDHTKGSAIYGLTKVRVVCWNTWSAALRQDDRTLLNIPHSTDVHEALAFQVALSRHAVDSRIRQQAELNMLFKRRINKGEFANIVEAAFPTPPKLRKMRMADAIPADMDVAQYEVVERVQAAAAKQTVDWERSVTRVESLRADVGAAYAEFNDTYPYAGGTAYAAFNAVTYTTNHGNFTGMPDKKMVSLLFGEKGRINERAYEAAMALV